MGLQFRKRTKGKKAWFNFSASRSRGPRGSVSLKLSKNLTLNLSKGRTRTTLNLGNGFRYVKTRSTKPKKEKPYVCKTVGTRSYVYDPRKIKSGVHITKKNDEPMDKTTQWILIIIVAIICFVIQKTIR